MPNSIAKKSFLGDWQVIWLLKEKILPRKMNIRQHAFGHQFSIHIYYTWGATEKEYSLFSSLYQRVCPSFNPQSFISLAYPSTQLLSETRTYSFPEGRSGLRERREREVTFPQPPVSPYPNTPAMAPPARITGNTPNPHPYSSISSLLL